MNKWTKRILAIVIGGGLVVLAGSRIYDLQQEKSQEKTAKKKKGGARVVSVDFSESETGYIREELILTGALKPKEQVDITPKATGRVEKIHVQVGDAIRTGQLVAELEDDELLQQVNRAEASIGVTRASLAQRRAERDNAQAELDRADSLFQEGLLSKQDLEALKTGLAVVNAQVALSQAQQEQAEAELKELKIRLAQSKIYSPLNGLVATRYVDEGALVSASTPILRVVNLSTMKSQGNVPERNIDKLRVGNETVVTVDAMPDREFRGRVARIAPVLDAATRSALIEIDIPNPAGHLKAEMFARIRLDTGTTREATVIPRDGLVYRGQQPGVYVVEGDLPVFRPIETGLTRADLVEVLANLEPGVTIVGRGATMIRDGDRVRESGAGGGSPKAVTKKADGNPEAQRSAQNHVTPAAAPAPGSGSTNAR